MSGESDAQAAVVLPQRNRFIFHGQPGSTGGNTEAVQHQIEDAKLWATLLAWNAQLEDVNLVSPVAIVFIVYLCVKPVRNAVSFSCVNFNRMKVSGGCEAVEF